MNKNKKSLYEKDPSGFIFMAFLLALLILGALFVMHSFQSIADSTTETSSDTSVSSNNTTTDSTVSSNDSDVSSNDTDVSSNDTDVSSNDTDVSSNDTDTSSSSSSSSTSSSSRTYYYPKKKITTITSSSTSEVSTTSNETEETSSAIPSSSHMTSPPNTFLPQMIVDGETISITSWKDVLTELQKMEQIGKTEATITLSENDTIVPSYIFGILKGLNIQLKIYLSSGAYWTINGEDISQSAFKDINLGLIENSTAIDSGLLKQLAGNYDYMAISLSHSGNFGFPITLTLPLSDTYAGLYANLFYFDPVLSTFDFTTSSKVEQDGTVSFLFSHASDYCIVFADTILDNSASVNSVSSNTIDLNATPDNTEPAPTLKEFSLSQLVPTAGIILFIIIFGSLILFRHQNPEHDYD